MEKTRSGSETEQRTERRRWHAESIFCFLMNLIRNRVEKSVKNCFPFRFCSCFFQSGEKKNGRKCFLFAGLDFDFHANSVSDSEMFVGWCFAVVLRCSESSYQHSHHLSRSEKAGIRFTFQNLISRFFCIVPCLDSSNFLHLKSCLRVHYILFLQTMA